MMGATKIHLSTMDLATGMENVFPMLGLKMTTMIMRTTGMMGHLEALRVATPNRKDLERSWMGTF